jgi:hypothetical protein
MSTVPFLVFYLHGLSLPPPHLHDLMLVSWHSWVYLCIWLPTLCLPGFSDKSLMHFPRWEAFSFPPLTDSTTQRYSRETQGSSLAGNSSPRPESLPPLEIPRVQDPEWQAEWCWQKLAAYTKSPMAMVYSQMQPQLVSFWLPLNSVKVFKISQLPLSLQVHPENSQLCSHPWQNLTTVGFWGLVSLRV